MGNLTRHYKTKDVDMCITALAIVNNAIKRKDDLQAARVLWQGDFFETLKTKTEYALKTYLGIDPAKDLVLSTKSLNALHKQILGDLARIKVQIMEDLKKQKEVREHLLRVLGFTPYLKQAQNGDQEGLINLLHQFKTNLTEEVKNQVTTLTGVPITLVESIAENADIFTSANVDQENFKSDRKVITAEAIKEFNEIYDEVISVAKIASNFFKDDKALKDQFSFDKISNTLNAKGKTSPRDTSK